MTTSRIGRGVLVTLAGTAASLAGAAGVANACETPTKPAPPTQGHHHDQTPPKKSTPATVCKVDDSDVQYAQLGKDGTTVVGGWHNAVTERFKGNSPEPVYGYQVRINPDIESTCIGTVDVSLASYDTAGTTWDTSGGAQTFVGFSHVTLSELSKTSVSQRLTVKLPGSNGGTVCDGQIDLYFGKTVYDGKTGEGHGPLPDHDHGVVSPTGEELITAWNGADADGCATTPTTQPSTPVTTPPATHPSTPVSSTTPTVPATPTTPKSTTSTPTTPATTTSTPGTPTLAHTGANVGEVSLVALMFFGAGGTAMFASRKAKTVGARRH